MIFQPYPLISLPLFLVGVTCLVLGIIVVLQSKKRFDNISFCLFSFALFLWCTLMGLVSLGFHPRITVLLPKFLFGISLLIPYSILIFSLSFPRGTIPFSKSMILFLALPMILLSYFLFDGWVLSTVVKNGGFLLVFGSLNYLYTFYYLIYSIVAGAILFLKYKKSANVEKIRYKYFFVGLFVGFSTALFFNVILFSIFRINEFVYLGPLSSIFVVAPAAYAILKYRLMDISLAIKKTTAYSLVTSAITFAYVLVVLAFEFLFRTILGYYSLLAAVPAALVVAVTFVPLRENLQKITDRLFFRQMIEYQKVIKDVTRMISSVTDASTLTDLINRTVVRVMDIKNASVLLLEEKTGDYVVEDANGLPGIIGHRLAPQDPIICYLREKKDAVIYEEIIALLRSDALPGREKARIGQVREGIDRFEAALVIPAFLKDKLVGIFTLGEKLSGELFSPDDLALLLTLASEAGIAIGNVELYRDITETRDYLNSLVQGSDDGIITFDLDGRTLSWNKGAQKIFGYSESEVAGRIPPIFEKREIEAFVNKILGGEDIKAIAMDKKNNIGRDIPLLVTLSPVRNLQGEIIAVAAIIKDITDLKKVDTLKRELLSVISHELRTPLSYIKLYISKMLDEELSNMREDQKESLSIIHEQSEHLHTLIDSVIDIAHVEAGKPVELQKEEFFFEEIIRESVKALAPAYSDKKINLEIMDSSDHFPIYADKKKMLKVMTSLLGNAQKFTPSGGKVRVVVEKEIDQCKVSVADTGIGITPDHLNKVFDRFYQIDTSYTREYGGIGMGLAITREIIRSHGGNIWAESEGDGKGATFHFTLPLNPR
jgi:PAS domain S-box-containing protein